MRSILIIVCLFPYLCWSQIDQAKQGRNDVQGIAFENNLTWKQVLEKAKSKGKFIFLECFTTWCGPCKQMERDIYSLPEVGEFYNSKFISVKMQMDTSKNDEPAVKEHYGDAHFILIHYKPEAYPTFLFFDSVGRLVSMDAGARNENNFVQMAKDAADLQKSYYALLEKYNKGERQLPLMSHLAQTAISLGDTVTADRIAREYMIRLNGADVLTKDNIDMMQIFTKTAKDVGFSFYYRNVDTINRIVGDDGYAQGIVQSFIFKEMVLPLLRMDSARNLNPDWSDILNRVIRKYNRYYADRVITSSKSTWALWHSNWSIYTKYLVEYVDRYGSKKADLLDLRLNNFAWAIFSSSTNYEELTRALSWSERAVLINPEAENIDTYANLLYKLNQRQKAIQWEMIALKMQPGNEETKRILDKMRTGAPTWPALQ